MISTTAMEATDQPSSLALNQLSEDDRKLVARLKQLYPSHILESVFQEGFPPLGESHISIYIDIILIATDPNTPWNNGAISPRDSVTSSTLYMTSVDGDTCSSSRTSRSSHNSFAEKTPLWKKRAASVPKASTVTTTTTIIKPRSRPHSRRGTSEAREIRIQLKPRPAQAAPLASIDAITTPTAPVVPTVEINALYFCTKCEESFQERTEWQDHEYTLHEQQYYWICQGDDCDKVFTKESVYHEHHVEAHECRVSAEDLENKRPLPSKRSWACGFDRCKGVFSDWEERCDHVAAHFEGLARLDDATQQPSEWKYTNVLRNLLRQPDIKEGYKRMMVKLHGDDKVFWPKMKWQVENSSELLRKLEYRDFREGVMEIARVACQLGHPASANAEFVKISVEASEDIEMAPSLLHQNNSYLHIDKFPTPGQNPFDLYGPVPPSPIIQLDFVSDPASPDPTVEVLHSTKSSISQNPYSLYPSPLIADTSSPLPTPPQPATKSATPSIFSNSSGDDKDNKSFASPSESFSFQTAATWATAYSTAGDASPPRPKTPMSMIRSARSLLKKRSAPKLSRTTSVDEEFDAAAAQQAIAFYNAR
jgi:hypothetical protein